MASQYTGSIILVIHFLPSYLKEHFYALTDLSVEKSFASDPPFGSTSWTRSPTSPV